jgi:rubredoxin
MKCAGCVLPAPSSGVIEWRCPNCGDVWRLNEWPAPNGGVTPSHWERLPRQRLTPEASSFFAALGRLTPEQRRVLAEVLLRLEP